MPVCTLNLAPDHPAFAGHFPGRPIVPGVVLLDLAQRCIEAEGSPLCGLASVKFLSPVLPGQPLELRYQVLAGGVSFEIRSADRLVTTGRFIRGATAAR